MLTIIQLLTLPLSLELNSGPREPLSDSQATASSSRLLARPLAPTATTATPASNSACNQPSIAPLFALSPLPRASRRRHQCRQPPTGRRHATGAPTARRKRPTASYKPSSRPQEPHQASAASVTRLHEPHTPLQRPTASYKPSSHLQESHQASAASVTRLQEPQQASAASSRLQEPQQVSAASVTRLQEPQQASAAFRDQHTDNQSNKAS
jgi:hypothetical protein